MIRPADLGWRNGQPYARDYGDIYHSPDESREVQRVFVEPAQLASKAAEAADRGATLRVGELGFGTGLNFAVCAALALKAGCRLHFVSCDARPISPGEFLAIARQRKARLPVYGRLEHAYPPLLAGWHRRVLAEGRICLSLYWGEAAAGLADLLGGQRQPIDAWFLDGFAPDRNEDMWREPLLGQIAGLSTAGTTVSTFTAAGAVRRGLQAGGFEMRRVDQRPHKRESLAGVFAGDGRPRRRVPARVTVAGAGMAGASIARHLAEQGISVNLYDVAEKPAAGASGIPALLLHPRLLADGSPQADWRAHAYAYSQAWASRFPGFVQGGVLQTLGPNLDAGKLRRIVSAYAASGLLQRLNHEQAMRIGGWRLHGDALYFPEAGIVNPAELIRCLLDHPRIDLRLRQQAPQGVQPLVLACAGAVRDHPSAGFLETAEVQGQVDVVTMPAAPRLAVVGDGYLAPTGDGVVAGATFEHRAWPVRQATERNLRPVAGRAYRWKARARAARTIASDRTPIVGELAPGLYASTAHGSMGMVSAPFAAALIASHLTGDLVPLDPVVAALVAPGRFHARQARRGFRMGAVGPHA